MRIRRSHFRSFVFLAIVGGWCAAAYAQQMPAQPAAPADSLAAAPEVPPGTPSLDAYRGELRMLFASRDYEKVVVLAVDVERHYPGLEMVTYYRSQSQRRIDQVRDRKPRPWRSLSDRPVEFSGPTPSPTPIPEAPLTPRQVATPDPSTRRTPGRVSGLGGAERWLPIAVGLLALGTLAIGALMIVRRRRSAQVLAEMETEAVRGADFSFESSGRGIASEAFESATQESSPGLGQISDPLGGLEPAVEAEHAEEPEPLEAPASQSEPEFMRETAPPSQPPPSEPIHMPDAEPVAPTGAEETEPRGETAPPHLPPWEAGPDTQTDRPAPPAPELPSVEDHGQAETTDVSLGDLDDERSAIDLGVAAAAGARPDDEPPAEEMGLTQAPSPESADTETGLRSPDADAESEYPALELPEDSRTSWDKSAEETEALSDEELAEDPDLIVLEPPKVKPAEVQVFHQDETVEIELQADQGEDTVGGVGEPTTSGEETRPTQGPAEEGLESDPFHKARRLGFEAFTEARWDQAVHHLQVAAALKPEAADVKDKLRQARRMRKS